MFGCCGLSGGYVQFRAEFDLVSVCSSMRGTHTFSNFK